MTAALTDFLLARYAEDYEVAYGAAPSPWKEGAWDGTSDGPREVLDAHGGVAGRCYYGGTYGHVLRFDPTRVLADIEAKRRIVEELAIPYIAERRRLMNGQPSWGDEHPELLRWLALPYADHPDYREEWKT